MDISPLETPDFGNLRYSPIWIESQPMFESACIEVVVGGVSKECMELAARHR